MTFTSYTRQISVISISLLLFSVILYMLLGWQLLLPLYFMVVISFVVFCTLIFMYAQKTSVSKGLLAFNNVVIASFVLKLIMSVGLILTFEWWLEPDRKYHIWHFLLIYLVYTIYETYFLTKLAKVERSR